MKFSFIINYKKMITKQPLQNNFIADKIYNIKGISWMLKTAASTNDISSNNSSHIDHQFKIFKLKDQKKKWKKKIHKKFQSVAQQIQANIRHKIQNDQLQGVDSFKQTDSKHTPHLKKSHSFTFTCDHLKEKINGFLNQKQKSNKETKNYRNSLTQEKNIKSHNNKSLPFFEGHNDPSNQIFRLRKVFAERKNQNEKITKSRNILKIYSKQKEFIEKQNNQFFGKEIKWIDNKVQYYNGFNILEYEKKLIDQRCLQSHK